MERDQDTLMLLADVARLMRTEADRRARAHGMTRAQWVILHWVDQQPGMSQRALAELLEVEPITVGRLVDRLEASGLVERRPDPEDRRIWRLHLLEAARPVVLDLERQCVSISAVLTEGMSPPELAVVMQGLRRMKANLLTNRRSVVPQDELREAG